MRYSCSCSENNQHNTKVNIQDLKRKILNTEDWVFFRSAKFSELSSKLRKLLSSEIIMNTPQTMINKIKFKLANLMQSIMLKRHNM